MTQLLTTSIPLLLTIAGEEQECICSVKYSYYPARPAYTPRGEYAPIDPPEPASAELHSCWLSLETPPGKVYSVDLLPFLSAQQIDALEGEILEGRKL